MYFQGRESSHVILRLAVDRNTRTTGKFWNFDEVFTSEHNVEATKDIVAAVNARLLMWHDLDQSKSEKKTPPPTVDAKWLQQINRK
jgi:hypothetical protein